MISGLLLPCIAIALLVGGAACTSRPPQNTLRLLVPNGIVGRALLKQFEQEYKTRNRTSITVEVDSFSFNDNLYALLTQDSLTYYDALMVSGVWLPMLCAADKSFFAYDYLQPLDPERLHPHSIYEPWTLGLSHYDRDNLRSRPYCYATCGIMYRPSTVRREEAKSWEVLWNPKFAGQIQMRQRERDLYAVTTMYLHRQLLRDSAEHYTYPRPYKRQLHFLLCYGPSTTRERVDSVVRALEQQAPLVKAYAGVEGGHTFAGSSATIAMCYSSEAIMAMEENNDVAFEIPADGSYVVMCSWGIPARAKNISAAYEFLQYINRSDEAHQTMNLTGWTSAIASTLAEVRADLLVSERYLSRPEAWRSQFMSTLLLSTDTQKRIWTMRHEDEHLEYLHGSIRAFLERQPNQKFLE
ncbi:MAG: extracellular solute-binding protein [Prevotellaceae bacterium]|jgi:spermidine/putrescine-binding protein|nr:extracellular solute-binding protein [Prevotellaceae bacterium]